MDSALDLEVRRAAFQGLQELVQVHGEVLASREIGRGFEYRGETVLFRGVPGIFKPGIMPGPPLSITSAPVGHIARYSDAFSEDGKRLLYGYRAGGPDHHQNEGMRQAMQRRLPMIYFHGVIRGEYCVAWPVYVIADERDKQIFHIAVDDVKHFGRQIEDGGEARREYITVTTRHRLHQQAFRARVLHAYKTRCALCRLQQKPLLDAAHIVPDRDPHGAPVVSNGLALCKIHHAAFDRQLIGIRPDYVVEVRRDILDDKDGPMLEHGLQRMHGERIIVPRNPDDRPHRDKLQERYVRFLGQLS